MQSYETGKISLGRKAARSLRHLDADFMVGVEVAELRDLGVWLSFMMQYSAACKNTQGCASQRGAHCGIIIKVP